VSRLVLSVSRLVVSVPRLPVSVSRLVVSVSRLSVTRLIVSVSRLVVSVSRLVRSESRQVVALSRLDVYCYINAKLFNNTSSIYFCSHKDFNYVKGSITYRWLNILLFIPLQSHTLKLTCKHLLLLHCTMANSNDIDTLHYSIKHFDLNQ